jgi:hypothetical protein
MNTPRLISTEAELIAHVNSLPPQPVDFAALSGIGPPVVHAPYVPQGIPAALLRGRIRRLEQVNALLKDAERWRNGLDSLHLPLHRVPRRRLRDKLRKEYEAMAKPLIRKLYP